MRFSRSPSALILIVVNLIPVFGVLYLDWQLFPLLFLFWAENVIIGVFNLIKILTCRPLCPISWAARIFFAPFFTVHYGMFTIGHGIFIFAMFHNQPQPAETTSSPFPPINIIEPIISEYHLFWPLLAMALSHGFSYIYNFLIKGEFLRLNPAALMLAPYGRIVILHITIILGGFAVQFLGEPIIALLLLVVLKTFMDLMAHLREHNKKDGPQTPATASN